MPTAVVTKSRVSPFIVLLAQSGVGKSTMMSNLKGMYLLDIEDRAGHLAVLREPFHKGMNSFEVIHLFYKAVTALSACKFENGHYLLPDDAGTVHEVSYLGIDTFDRLQTYIQDAVDWIGANGKGLKYGNMRTFERTEERGSRFRDARQQWGLVLEITKGFIFAPLQKLRIPVIIAAHSQERSTEVSWKAQDADIIDVPQIDMAIGGQTRRLIMEEADLVLHMMYDAVEGAKKLEMKRIVISQPALINGAMYMAKDTMNLVQKPRMEFEITDGHRISGENPLAVAVKILSGEIERGEAERLLDAKRKAEEALEVERVKGMKAVAKAEVLFRYGLVLGKETQDVNKFLSERDWKLVKTSEDIAGVMLGLETAGLVKPIKAQEPEAATEAIADAVASAATEVPEVQEPAEVAQPEEPIVNPEEEF